MLQYYKSYWKIVGDQIGELSDELKTLYLKMVAFNEKKRPNID